MIHVMGPKNDNTTNSKWPTIWLHERHVESRYGAKTIQHGLLYIERTVRDRNV